MASEDLIARLDRELAKRLRADDHRVTAQRLFVHRALRTTPGHHTAEQVLASVSKTLPSISLPTVYATLELFEQLGLVRRVSVGTGALLFDSRTSPHAHAVCRRCGAVADVEEPDPHSAVLRRAKADGFNPDEARVTVFGTCDACAHKQAKATMTTASA